MNIKPKWISLVASLALCTPAIAAAPGDGDKPTTSLAPVTYTGTVVLNNASVGGVGSGWIASVEPTGKRVKGAFLGIFASTATPALRTNLKLSEGVGLVVERVEPNSPAESAGVQQYDIVQKFNDQILINPQQLGVLVRLGKPDDTVTLQMLRKGDPLTITAKLVERDLPPLAEETSPWLGTGSNTFTLTNPSTGEPYKKALDYLRYSKGSNASFVYRDANQTMEISRVDGQRHLLAKDLSGKVLFDGPIETDAQRKALPATIRDKLDKFDKRTQTLGVKDLGQVRVKMVEPGETDGMDPPATQPAP